VWVGDRGFSSAANRRALRAGDHHYILSEKLRGDDTPITIGDILDQHPAPPAQP